MKIEMEKEKELIELFDAVKRAADAAAAAGPEEESRCLDALKQLKKFPVNYHVLVSTQVGKRLRLLTKHPREKIQALASDVVRDWKTIIVRETTKNKNGNGVNRESVKSECAGADGDEGNKFQSVNSIKAEKVSRGGCVKVESSSKIVTPKSERAVKSESSFMERQSENVTAVKTESTTSKSVKLESIAKNEKLSSCAAPPKLPALICCKDSVRDKVRELLAEALCKVSGEADEDLKDAVNDCDPYRVAVQVETAMFEKWGRSNGAQKFKYRSIMFNIKDPNNPDFRRKVLLGQYPPCSIIELSPEDMASDERQKENNKIKEKALFNSQLGGPPVASTDKFKCGRCGKNQTTYYQMQTRSADEPMTTYVTCINCDNRWKFC